MYKPLIEQIEDLVAHLRSSDSQRRKEAAERIRQLGLYSQKSLDPRGTFTKAAENRLKEGLLNAITNSLRDRDIKVKTASAAAVGEWGGETSVRKLIEESLVKDKRINKEYAYAVVSALRNIGGPDASRVLAELSVQNKLDEGVRLAAISALEEIIWNNNQNKPSQDLDESSLAEEIIEILEEDSIKNITKTSQLAIRQRTNEVIEILRNMKHSKNSPHEEYAYN